MDKMTDNQQALIAHLFNRLRIYGEGRKEVLAELMERPFTDMNEITKSDASKIINGLKSRLEAK